MEIVTASLNPKPDVNMCLLALNNIHHAQAVVPRGDRDRLPPRHQRHPGGGGQGRRRVPIPTCLLVVPVLLQ